MTFETASRMQVVRKQEKEPRLKDFIRNELSRIPASTTGQPVTCMLVARTIESPVVRALAAHATELQARAITVRTILSSLDVPPEGTGPVSPQWLSACPSRWMRNVRLVDAHEFLIIGDNAAWIGDCMRRDPQKRDAFESYNPDSPAVASQSRRSFERLWSLSEAVPSNYRWTAPPPPQAEESTPAATGAAAAAAALDANTPPTPGATRH
jgi:hypothetical protein